MAFMILFGLTIAAAVILINFRVIRKTYFGEHGARNLFALLLALVSGTLAVVDVFAVRLLYVPSTEETPNWWRQVQGLDAFAVTVMLVVCGLLFIYFKTWYRRNPLRRLVFVTSLQTLIWGGSGLLHARALQDGRGEIGVWAILTIAGLGVLVFTVATRRRELAKDLGEFLKSADE
jgi:hypothetical protein